MPPSPDFETKRRAIILLLCGLLALLAFSLYALYDYHFGYERSDDPISYEKEDYVEFYFYSNGTASSSRLNVTLGVANFLGEDRNLSVAWAPAPNSTGVVPGRYNFSVRDSSVKHLDLQLEFGSTGTAAVRFLLLDESGAELSRLERGFQIGV